MTSHNTAWWNTNFSTCCIHIPVTYHGGSRQMCCQNWNFAFCSKSSI